MMGPNTNDRWYLMVAWFDVFGQFRTKASYFARQTTLEEPAPEAAVHDDKAACSGL